MDPTLSNITGLHDNKLTQVEKIDSAFFGFPYGIVGEKEFQENRELELGSTNSFQGFLENAL